MEYVITRVDRSDALKRTIVKAGNPKQALEYFIRRLEIGYMGQQLLTYTRISNTQHKASILGATYLSTIRYQAEKENHD